MRSWTGGRTLLVSLRMLLFFTALPCYYLETFLVRVKSDSSFADNLWGKPANLLIESYGVGPGQRVVCVFSRCLEMCAFILGVLKAGAQYVPVDGAVMIEENLRQYVTVSMSRGTLSDSREWE